MIEEKKLEQELGPEEVLMSITNAMKEETMVNEIKLKGIFMSKGVASLGTYRILKFFSIKIMRKKFEPSIIYKRFLEQRLNLQGQNPNLLYPTSGPTGMVQTKTMKPIKQGMIESGSDIDLLKARESEGVEEAQARPFGSTTKPPQQTMVFNVASIS
jgi:hypothetical protein